MENEKIPVDINRASLEELTSVRGIGPVMAERIIAGRPFERLESLSRVQGLSARIVEQIRPMITVETLDVPGVQGEAPEAHEAEPDVENSVLETPSEAPEEQIPSEVSWPVETSAIQEVSGEIPPPVSLPVDTPIMQEVLEEPSLAAEPVSDQSNQKEPEKVMPESTAASQVETGAHKPVEPVDIKASDAQQKTSANSEGGTSSLLLVLGSSLIALLLGVALTLGILSVINGGLRYASDSQAAALSHQIDTVQSQSDTLSQDVNGLRTRLDALESLSGRISTLEDQTTTMQAKMNAQATQIADLNAQTQDLQNQLDGLKEQTTVFQKFLEGMKSLVDGLFK